MSDAVEKNPWAQLKAFTNARIALGRAGSSLPTAPLLAFNLSHAQARDAVHQPLDSEALRRELDTAGFATLGVQSAAVDRQHYLRRPISAASCRTTDARCWPATVRCSTMRPMWCSWSATGCPPSRPRSRRCRCCRPCARGCTRTAGGSARWWWRRRRASRSATRSASCCARAVAMLIGERPGLSSPDSLGVYLTWAPKVGCHDAQRNCISNVRPEGLPHAAAAHKLHYLMTEARRLRLTGVGLKDDSDALLPPQQAERIGAA
jgi:ethanolamine ammonia-lyase small subunit